MTAAEASSQPTTATPEAAAPPKKQKVPKAPADKPGPTPAPAVSESAQPATPTPGAAEPVGDVRNLQAKFNGLLDQRNQMNDLAKTSRVERDQLNEQRRVKSEEIEVHKTARDAANEVMRKHKEIRNAYQDQAKALIAEKKGKAGAAAVERSLPLTVRKLRNDIQAMVEQQQTTILSPSKEKVLVEKIRDLWLELKEKETELKKQKAVEIDLGETDNAIDTLFAKADEEHAHVVAALKEASAHHEKFIAGVKEIRVLVTEANKKHAEFIAAKQKADECHTKAMELREKVMAVRNERKAAFDAERREVQQVNTQARRSVADPKALERIKDQELEKLKAGGKITLGF